MSGFPSWVLVGAAVLTAAAPPILAHPGRTDSSGCHTCRTNCPKWGLRYGQYHCHGGGTRSGTSRISRPSPPPPPSPPPSGSVRVLREDELADGAVPENSIVLLREDPEGQRIGIDVMAVVDGDTFVARRGDRLYLMRLRDIEAPEHGQPFGDAARQRLAELVDGRRIVIRPTTGVGCVIAVRAEAAGRQDVSERLLAEGFAWATASAPEPWRRLEQSARLQKAGLWRGSAPEPPWEFRRRTGGMN